MLLGRVISDARGVVPTSSDGVLQNTLGGIGDDALLGSLRLRGRMSVVAEVKL